MIVQRGAGGQIATTDPTADVHVVNLQTMNAALKGKVDKEEGKVLSSNDFTQEYIDKIAELENSFPTVTRLV